VLSPSFSPSDVTSLTTSAHLLKPSYDLSSKPYIPGYIGLNNIKRNDHMNVIIHCLLHVRPLRDFLLLSRFDGKQPEMVKRFAALAKKLWNPRLFKSQVSPHEFLQEVGRASGGKFRLETQGDPVEFLRWLLNDLHKDLGGTKKKNSSKSCYCGAFTHLFMSGVLLNRYHLLYLSGTGPCGDSTGCRSSRCIGKSETSI
jgi:U4/U6.U5 tri-snRNP-associated protein 2